MSVPLCAWVLAALLTSSDVPVEPPAGSTSAPSLHALRFSWTEDGGASAAMAAMLGGGFLFRQQLLPTRCLVCDLSSQGGNQLWALDVWGRTALRGDDAEDRLHASQWSDALQTFLLPAGALGAEVFLVATSAAPWPWLAEDGLMITESVLLSSLANQVVKFSVARIRPYAHARVLAGEPLSDFHADDLTSFYSGHTSFAFNLVVSLGTLAELRGYPGRVWIWAVGLPLAALVPPLRMAADKHYLSDVLVGAVVGSALGVAVPLLLHGREASPRGSSLAVTVAPGGAALVGCF